jgi:hypothetical protein
VRREPRDDGWGGHRRRGPNEKHGDGPVERWVERFGDSKIARDDFDASREHCVFRPARECAH